MSDITLDSPTSPIARTGRPPVIWAIVAVQAAVHGLAVLALTRPTVEAMVAAAVTLSVVGNFGISVGYHRILAHRAARGSRVLEGALAFIGVLALQGGPLRWVCMHRAHHALENDHGDPHAASEGFWWSHQLWAFVRRPNGFSLKQHGHLIRDLERSVWLRFLDRQALWINVWAFLAVGLLLGWTIALWSFPLRIAVLWHVTWAINSVTHAAWRRPVPGNPRRSSARNVPWLALLTFGEGWHANHHARPAAPVFTDRAWHFDSGGWTLLALRALGLVRFRHDNDRS